MLILPMQFLAYAIKGRYDVLLMICRVFEEAPVFTFNETG